MVEFCRFRQMHCWHSYWGSKSVHEKCEHLCSFPRSYTASSPEVTEGSPRFQEVWFACTLQVKPHLKALPGPLCPLHYTKCFPQSLPVGIFLTHRFFFCDICGFCSLCYKIYVRNHVLELLCGFWWGVCTEKGHFDLSDSWDWTSYLCWFLLVLHHYKQLG